MKKRRIAWPSVGMLLLCGILSGLPTQRVYAVNEQEIKTESQEIKVQAAPGQEASKETEESNDSYDRSAEAASELRALLERHDVMALVYLEPILPLNFEASFDSGASVEVSSGQTVFIREITADEEGVIWAFVDTYLGEEMHSGYIPRAYLACSDEDYLQWEREYIGDGDFGVSVYEGREGRSADIEAFPESYRNALYALKAAHPNWTFVRMDARDSWNTVVSEQMKDGRSLVYKTDPDYFKGPPYDEGDWFYATEGILKYYLDPRNWLNQDGIFQFELLTYNRTYHTESAVDMFLNNTFMNNRHNAPGTNMTFAHIFSEVGERENVSPFHLAARVYQEQQGGTSALISGTYPGFEGFYNYFNIKASGTTRKEIIENGLKYAKSQGWYNAYEAILGGSREIAKNYISRGQDTLYLQKFNVSPQSSTGYWHQYMQNLAAPSSEGKKVMSMYQRTNALENTFVFKIPVYGNMPASVCTKPTGPDVKADGWHDENGGRYWYENGVRQGTEGDGKEIYDPQTNAWYWLDGSQNGRMAVNKDVYLKASGKWVRYGSDGKMVKGEDYRFGGWYRFDEGSGAMIKGWYVGSHQGQPPQKYFYDLGSGQMVFGQVIVDGQYLYFDRETGVAADKVWVWIEDGDYWYEGGIRQGYDPKNPAYRGKEIYDPGSDAWYWLDNVDKGRKAVSKDVYQESNGGKWVRYDGDGRMIKGWDTNENGTYYFDPVTGAMAKGEVVIDGQIHRFDEKTGIEIW